MTSRNEQTPAFTGVFRMATWTGLEPVASAVTGRRSNQLSYQAKDDDNLLPRGGRR